eukprot:10138227-Ditylum_brightwellii.AAC.1
MIDGHQCALVWYVDDNKVSHKSAKVADEILEMMKRYFGKLTITQSKEQQFLRVNFKIRKDKKLN